jgi:hypothetical protein
LAIHRVNARPSKKSDTPPEAQRQLTPMPEKGEPPEERLANASAGIQVFNEFHQADDVAAFNRAQIQGLIDGNPPYAKGANRRQGHAFSTNLDFGEAYAITKASQSSYTDLIEGVDVLFRHQLPVQVPDREEMEDVINQEKHRMMKHRWEGFYPNWDILSGQFDVHGVGFLHWPDDTDWKYECGGWDDFLMPRQTRVTESNVEVLISVREMPIHKLYAFIKDEDSASKTGWNVKATRQEIVAASKGAKFRKDWAGHWPGVQRDLKNNDYGRSFGGNNNVLLLHFWVTEFDGTISHYIAARDQNAASSKDHVNPDWLYKKRSKFKKASSAYLIFNSGVGNGDYHSIRGLGLQIYAGIMESNKLRCNIIDSAKLASKMIFKSGNMDRPAISIQGPFGIMDSEAEVVQVGIQDRSEGMMRVMNDLSGLIQNNTGSHRSRAVNPSSQDKTKFELLKQADLESNLTVSQINLFYRSWHGVGTEVHRRIVEIGKMAPKRMKKKFPEVAEFYERCELRGVPKEVIAMVDDVIPERAIGMGSPAARQAALDRLLQIQGSFPEANRVLFLRDYTAAVMNDRTRVDRYMPLPEESRPVLDEKMALFENNDMQAGLEVMRLKGENDLIHAEVHFAEIEQAAGRIEEMRMTGQGIDVEAVMPDLQFLNVALAHTNEHVNALAGDKLRAPYYGALRQGLQNVEGIFINTMKSVKQMIAAERPTGPEISEEDKMKWEKQKVEQQRLWDQHQFNKTLKVAELQDRMELKRAEVDNKIANSLRTQRPALTNGSRR